MRTRSLPRLLHERAQQAPDRLAFAHFDDGERESDRVTHGELLSRVCAVAEAIAAAELGDGPLLLLYPAGIDFLAAFLGCLHAGRVAVPLPAPGRGRGRDMLAALATAASASGVLTTHKMSDALESERREGEQPMRVPALPTDRLRSACSHPAPVEVRDSELAYLQFTSGSTSIPKGVMLTHGNLWANSEAIRSKFELGPDCAAMTWLPHYHDMGLVGGYLQPLFAGYPGYLMPPVACVQKPVRWLRMMTRFELMGAGGPTFGYEMCCERISEEEREGLDLRNWWMAYVGAEPVRAEVLERFGKTFAPYGFASRAFYPCYGLAESTVFVTGGTVGAEPRVLEVDAQALLLGEAMPVDGGRGKRLISCGQAPVDSQVRIVDPDARTRVKDGRVGEIWARGPSVARGYWGAPEASQETFGAMLPGEHEPYLRTGDLGFLHDGELYVAGRLKELLIVRGRNHHPHDIELTAERAHQALQPGAAAVFLRDEERGEGLTAALELRRSHYRSVDAGAVASAVRQAVLEGHALEVERVVLLRPLGLPKTSSGKPRRRACRDRLAAGSLPVIADTGGDRPPPPRARPATRQQHGELLARVIGWLAERQKLAPARVDPDRSFADHGLDSVRALELAAAIGQHLGRDVPVTLLFDHPTPRALSAHLTEAAAPGPGAPPESTASGEMAIAVVGLAFRFPGAADASSLWTLLCEGRHAIERPRDRPWLSSAPLGGYLEQLGHFDAALFGISPREARAMDPQQRLLLMLAWEALESAGIAPDRTGHDRCGVFAGASGIDFARAAGPGGVRDLYDGTGGAASLLAGRVAHALGLQGPALTVDTACSSSLVAVHLAARSLGAFECDVALAGGVNALLSDDVTRSFAAAGMLAPDGLCKAFDERADGYVRSEGGGLVTLKRLPDAVRDGDAIHAVVLGSAINHDGRSNGLTAPNGSAQRALIREALRRAGVRPEQISYVEAHGTGTKLGDPIELAALADVLDCGVAGAGPCAIGSVKANLGHLEAAAGIAGLIKLVLCLRHGERPPQAGFETPNRQLAAHLADARRLRIDRARVRWTAEPRVAGVSSFGLSGTNAHLVVAQPPQPTANRVREHERANPALIAVSALDSGAVLELRERVASHLERHPEDLCGTARTLLRGRARLRQRVAVAGHDAAQCAALLRAEPTHEVATTPGKVAFVFAGHGSQWPGMGRELLRTEPEFRAALERCDAAIARQAGFSVIAQLTAEPAHSRLDENEVVQPLLFAMSIGLAALWRALGLTPDAVVGHSMGEIAAAHVAGILELEDAVRVVVRRSQQLRRILGRGRMALVGLPLAQAKTAAARFPDELAVAVNNSPGFCVLSGERATLEALIASLQADGVFCRFVQVDYASHSPQIDALREPLLDVLAPLSPRAGEIAMCSTVSGAMIDGRTLDASYWVRNLREPVLFADAVEHLIGQGFTTFVELGPHPLLPPSIVEVAQSAGRTVTAVGSLQRDQPERASLLRACAALFNAGHELDWERVTGDGPRAAAPTYPFQLQPYPLLPRSAARPHSASCPDGTQLLGPAVRSSLDPNTWLFERTFELEDLPVLAHHRVGGMVVLPAAAYATLGHGASLQALGGRPSLCDLSFEELLVLEPGSARVVQTAVVVTETGACRFQVASRAAGATSFVVHATGRAELSLEPAGAERRIDLADLSQRMTEVADCGLLYDELRAIGLDYGEHFRRLLALEVGEGQALSRIDARGASAASEPALLDACFHALAALLRDEDSGRQAYLPAGIERCSLPSIEAGELFVHVRLLERGARVRADFELYDGRGARLGHIEGLALARMDARPVLEGLSRVTWPALPLPRAPRDRTAARHVVWLAPEAAGDDPVLAELQRAGCGVTVVGCDDALDVERWLAQAPAHAALQIVSGRALAGAAERSDTEARGRWAERCFAAAVELLQALFASDAQRPMRVWLLTCRAQVLEREVGDPLQRVLWGLARCAQLELPALDCGVIDLGSWRDPSTLQALAAELLADDGERQLVMRGSDRRAARIAPAIARPSALPALAPDRTYLITGGTGALGRSLAHYLCDRGARHLMLTSRSAPGALQRAWIEALRARGVQIEHRAADAASFDQTRRVFAALEAMPALAGVFHLAGCLADATIATLRDDRLGAVLGPKILGALHLERLCEGRALDHFVLFGSAASVVGSPGQASYAAANAVLDGLAESRAMRGLPGLSIAWGPFGDAGLAAADGRAQRLSALGVTSLVWDDARAALDRLLCGELASVAVLRLRGRQWLDVFPHLAAIPTFAALASGDRQPASDGRLRADLEAMDEGSRLGHLERTLCGEVARILQTETGAVDPERPLRELGLDSLPALELRNRIELLSGVRVSAAAVFNHPHVHGIARHLLRAMGLDPAAAGDASAPLPEQTPQRRAQALEGLSDDELMRKLVELAAP